MQRLSVRRNRFEALYFNLGGSDFKKAGPGDEESPYTFCRMPVILFSVSHVFGT